ncbi:MAG: methyl-accepting chemotaxis protein [Enterobacteriaceae bacterium]
MFLWKVLFLGRSMFKNFKISTGIAWLGFAFMFALVGLAALNINSVLNDNQATKNSNDMTKRADSLNYAALELYRGISRIESLNIHRLAGGNVTPEDIKPATEMLQEAKRLMSLDNSALMKNISSREKTLLTEIMPYFEVLYGIGIKKLNSLINNQPIHSLEASEIEARDTLVAKTREYNSFIAKFRESVEAENEKDYQKNLIVDMSVVALMLALGIIAYLWMRHALIYRLQQTSAYFKTMAAGDLTDEIVVGSRNEIGLMQDELQKMQSSLKGTVSGIREGVEQIYLNSQEIAAGNNDLSSRTEEQAAALQQTAASMEELKITVRKNADNAHSAREYAASASDIARNGGIVMESVVEIMKQITDSSRQIADINNVIDSIANQTNILALNAAVEAARAGEQGRGFAVVAGEVRNLAKRSADAAKEIRGLIATSEVNVSTGSQQVEKAGQAMQDIVSSVTQVNDIMGEITLASEEQSTGINQIALAVNEMDTVTQQNAALVEQSAAAAGNMEVQTKRLGDMVSIFKIINAPEVMADSRNISFTTRNIKASEIKMEKAASGNIAEEEWTTF